MFQYISGFSLDISCILKVLEMDGLLRNHQADTAAHRLQLERTLAQRQGDLRARTQELEDISIKYAEVQKVCMCACVYVCMGTWVHVCIGACVHWCMCACVHWCMCACNSNSLLCVSILGLYNSVYH